jgi:protein-disulfide isomerase
VNTRLVRRLAPLVLALVVAAVAAGVSLATGSGGGRPDTSNLRFVADAHATVGDVPSRSNVLGYADAPVTIHEYADLRCPACREWDVNVLSDVVHQLVRTHKARLSFEVWPILGENSVYAGRAAYAAAQQNKLWEYAQIVYFNQGDERDSWFDQSFARAVASAAGLNMTQFDQDFAQTSKVNAQSQATDTAATKLGLQGTPSLRISGRGGQPITITGSVPTYDQIAQAVDRVSAT